jgi:MFS family permease
MFRWVFLFVLVGLGTAGACLAVLAPPLVDTVERKRRRVSRVEWAMPVGILVVLFTAFALVQLAALFGGSAYVLRTSNLSYAEYARSGFWQLLAVTVLTLGVVTAAARWAPRETPGDRLWLRGLLGALSVLMLVVVASALTRMWTYQQAYGFTVQRLVVEACELWLGVVYVLVIAAGARLRSGWLPQAIVGSALAGLLVFAWLNPERMIADHNVTRWQDTGKIDVDYLTGLSTDAAPELARLPPDLRPCIVDRSDRDWRNWNLSRSLRQETAQQGCRSF